MNEPSGPVSSFARCRPDLGLPRPAQCDRAPLGCPVTAGVSDRREADRERVIEVVSSFDRV